MDLRRRLDLRNAKSDLESRICYRSRLSRSFDRSACGVSALQDASVRCEAAERRQDDSLWREGDRDWGLARGAETLRGRCVADGRQRWVPEWRAIEGDSYRD